MKLTCVIIDDEPYAVNLLKEYAARMSYLEVVKTCFNAMEALEFLGHKRSDIIFLDINLPKLSGMQLARVLDPSQKIIFTTAYAQYAVESYSVNAVDYLLKPVTFEGFVKAIEKIKLLKSLPGDSEDPGVLFVKSGKAMIRISYDQIAHIEGLKDYVVFHTASGKHIVYKRMKDLEEILPFYFKRIHLSYIINTRHLQKIQDNMAYVFKEPLPIGEKYREEFMTFIRTKTM
jgi:two-component system, LytTR family, response regulator